MPHPEYYGESIIELANGMVTDVYTDQNGFLFTETNDEKLIDYLSIQKNKDESIVLEFQRYTLKSVDISDAKTIREWFLISPYRRANAAENDINIVFEYISHARTMQSDVFIIRKNNSMIGLLGYTIIDCIAILNCDIYNHSKTTTNEISQLLQNFINYLRKYNLLKIISIRVFEYDGFLLSVLSTPRFKDNKKTKILIPTLSGTLAQYEIEIDLI